MRTHLDQIVADAIEPLGGRSVLSPAQYAAETVTCGPPADDPGPDAVDTRRRALTVRRLFIDVLTSEQLDRGSA